MSEPKSFTDLSAGQKMRVIICSLGGVGYLPASGTAGSAATLLLLLIPFYDMHLLLQLATLVFTTLGVLSISTLEDVFGDDPSIVVIDEAAGMSLTLASPLIPLEPLWILLGFLFFRLFDIVKPWPINKIDGRHGAWAVMGDDLLAAVFASLSLHAVFHFSAIGALLFMD